jgi:hypothetical protein
MSDYGTSIAEFAKRLPRRRDKRWEQPVEKRASKKGRNLLCDDLIVTEAGLAALD